MLSTGKPNQAVLARTIFALRFGISIHEACVWGQAKKRSKVFIPWDVKNAGFARWGTPVHIDFNRIL